MQKRMVKMRNYKIRAHHGLCLAFFKGEGYSSDFVNNMKEVIEKLSEDPIITITTSLDDICISCPNSKDGICESIDKVNRYDNLVLKQCGLECGETMLWSEFQNKVFTKIIAAGKMDTICRDCEWSYICFES
ncbi:hypothetical protein EDD66_101403 [Mobilisporobacter senegalensis]|uniref:DUF1284 domain-containing protein n=1 Tax=Mobilisporobacter senegalensis TaxID=1329262 RepID=A0A3N1XYU7_9FIRM|nr:DUF1284 domain-containing protein [Mobilisporobacter senegalensis]ROR31785.1 hypothetical protein EDD66_101403 [Mobilisporobacter senegalensis]